MSGGNQRGREPVVTAPEPPYPPVAGAWQLCDAVARLPTRAGQMAYAPIGQTFMALRGGWLSYPLTTPVPSVKMHTGQEFARQGVPFSGRVTGGPSKQWCRGSRNGPDWRAPVNAGHGRLSLKFHFGVPILGYPQRRGTVGASKGGQCPVNAFKCSSDCYPAGSPDDC